MAARRNEDLRTALLEAAERLLAQSAPLSTRAVQREAGVSSGTFFHYFPSLDELLLAVARRRAGQQADHFGDPVAEPIEAVLGRLFDPDRRDTVLPWLRQRAIDAPELRSSLRAYDAAVSAEYAQAINASPVAGPLADVDLPALIELVRALAEGYQLRVSSGTLGIEPERFLAVLLSLLPQPVSTP